MSNESKLLAQFRVHESDLEGDQNVLEAYSAYCSKRSEFSEAHRAFNEASRELHRLLDGPLHSNGLVPNGSHFTFKDDRDEGLYVYVWSESKQRGKRRPEVPLQRLALGRAGK